MYFWKIEAQRLQVTTWLDKGKTLRSKVRVTTWPYMVQNTCTVLEVMTEMHNRRKVSGRLLCGQGLLSQPAGGGTPLTLQHYVLLSSYELNMYTNLINFCYFMSKKQNQRANHPCCEATTTISVFTRGWQWWWGWRRHREWCNAWPQAWGEWR